MKDVIVSINIIVIIIHVTCIVHVLINLHAVLIHDLIYAVSMTYHIILSQPLKELLFLVC